MKCKYCNGTGTSNTCVNGTFKPCTFCDGTGEYEPFDLDVELDKLYPTEQTNEEWIKQANTEQLAEEVYKLVWCSNELFQQMECSGIDTKENDLKIVTEWLKQPHKPFS